MTLRLQKRNKGIQNDKDSKGLDIDHQKDRPALTAGNSGSGIKYTNNIPRELIEWGSTMRKNANDIVKSRENVYKMLNSGNRDKALEAVERALAIHEICINNHRNDYNFIISEYQRLYGK